MTELNVRHPLKSERPLFARRMEARRRRDEERANQALRLVELFYQKGMTLPTNFFDEIHRLDGMIRVEPRE